MILKRSFVIALSFFMAMFIGYCQLIRRNEGYCCVKKRKDAGEQWGIGGEVWLCRLLHSGHLIASLESTL